MQNTLVKGIKRGRAYVWKEKISQKNMTRKFSEELIRNRTAGKVHAESAKADTLEYDIKEGNVDKVKEHIENLDANFMIDSIGKLSMEPTRNYRYLIIISMSFAVRAAIKGGVIEEDAYTLNDVYVREVDLCDDIADMTELYGLLLIELAQRVRNIKNETNVSEPIKCAIDYISKNLNKSITIDDVAKEAMLSVNYLCCIFKTETGMTVSNYIQKIKIEEAKKMLSFSNYSMLEISEILGFCTQSYFSTVFQKYTGMTPRRYRKVFYNTIAPFELPIKE